MTKKYVIGLDFGTESGRALLVAVDSGEELATAVMNYGDGVIDDILPGTGTKLPPDWALQNPRDYLCVLETVVPQVLQEAGVSGEDVIGLGVDFTACTLIPIDAEGQPLSMDDRWVHEPHAWPKLWKHHGAQAQATRLNEIARARNEAFLARYGGAVNSEWLLPKALQVLEEAPEVYEATDRFMEAGDWLVLQLTGKEARNACAAGYKATWDEGYPGKDLLAALNPAFETLVEDKLSSDIYPMGAKAGELTEAMAARLGLAPGTAVAVAGIDAHVAVPAAAVTSPGPMVIIMGTSFCHMVCSAEKKLIEGISGVVKDGILPNLYGYEAGQAAGGDIYAWFIKHCVPAAATEAASAAGMDIHAWLSHEAGQLEVGESGLVALDWWNGNRSVLVDAELSGLFIGMNLGTTPAEMYRALLESTAFGTYTIIRQFEEGGIEVKDLVACGGLPGKNPLLMQIFADVTGRSIRIAASDQTVALGAAMWGAVAAGAEAGGHADVSSAAVAMARLRDEVYTPDVDRHRRYQGIYAEYLKLHDYFGRGGNDVMKRLRALRHEARKA